MLCKLSTDFRSCLPVYGVGDLNALYKGTLCIEYLRVIALIAKNWANRKVIWIDGNCEVG